MTRIYYTIFSLIALSVGIYTSVDIFYRIVRSQLRQVPVKGVLIQETRDVKHSRRVSLDSFRAITDRNLFGSHEGASDKAKEEEIGDLEPTSLKVALLGTVIGVKQEDYAVIEETAKRTQDLYRVGDSLQNATVRMILRGKVVLRVGDTDEILTM